MPTRSPKPTTAATNMAANRTILYLRSTYQYGLELQVDALYRHAEAKGYVVVDVVEDRWSGNIAPGIQKELIKRKKKINDFDILFAVELTRLSEKDTDTTKQICQALLASGIALAFMNSRVVPIPPFRREHPDFREELRGCPSPLGRIGAIEVS